MSGARVVVEERADGAAGDAGGDSVEDRARRMGWRPEAEYTGPAGKFRSADEFVRHGETNLPVMRDRLRRTEEALNRVERKLEARDDVITDLNRMMRSSEQRAYDRAKAELEERTDAAIDIGDKSAVRKAARELAELEANKPKPPAERVAPVPGADAHAPPPPQDAIDWRADNPWFAQYPEMQQRAIAIHQGLIASDPHLTVKANLAAVRERIVREFPDRFPGQGNAPPAAASDDNPARQRASSVASSSAPGGPGRPAARSFEAMPKEAQDVFYRYEKTGTKTTKAAWAKDYWGEE